MDNPLPAHVYADVVRSMADPLLLVDASTDRVADANEAFAALLGYARADLIGVPLTQLIVTTPERLHRVHERVRIDGFVKIGNGRLRHRDGHLVDVDSMITKLELDGRMLLCSVHRDIRERLLAERAIAERERMFRMLFESLPVGVFIHDKGRILDANPALGAILHMTREEMLRYHGPDVVHPDDRPLVIRSIAHNDEQPIEVRAMRKDGSVVPVELRPRIFERDGVSLRCVVLSDLTERRAAAKALAESEARWRTLAEAAFEGIAVVEDGKIVDCTEQLGALLRRTRESLIGASVLALMAPESADEVRMRMASADTGHYEARMVRADGSLLHVELRARWLNIEGKRVRVAVVRDLTARDEIEARVRETEKLQVVGRLAASVAHDFNNLLTIIIGNATFLRTLDTASAARESIDELSVAADRASALTRQLLAFSRQPATERRVLDPDVAVRGTIGMLGRLLGPNVRVDLSLDAGGALVHIDPGQLEQVVMNLCTNARDAMPSGGVITLRTRRESSPVGERVVLEVSDVGIGMDGATLARAFEPFFTTKSSGRGTGLGLASVRDAVVSAGGDVSMSSAPGTGTTVTIYLPVHGAQRRSEAPISPAKLHRGSEHVLVIDDEPLVRAVCKRALESRGYRVSLDTGEHFESVLALIGDLDLVVCDVAMRGIGGPETVRRIRQVRAELPVFFISGYSGEPGVRDPLLDELPLLTKPFSPEALAAKVRAVLDRRV